jgi:signal transduction histidine kinase
MIASLYFTLRLGLYPLRRISEQAAQIGPSTLDARLPLSSAPREVAPLVMAFNAALDRLEAGWRAQRHFSANAAHELRNPLATLRAQVESLLGSDERAAAVEEFERLGRLVEQLLDLAEAEGGASGATGAFDIVALSRAIARDMASRIIASERTLSFETALDRHIVNGQADLAEMALRNLLDNAVRHTPKGAEILLAIDAQGVTSVIDDGPGVIADLKPRLFQRFSRGDPNGAGAGLGLSIVRQVMERNGGSVWLADLPRGACFSLQFRTSRDLV